MCRSGMSLCLLVSLMLVASVHGGRVVMKHNFSRQIGAGGPHKCTITWKFRENGGVSQVARVSFGVSGCRTQCLATNAHSHYDKMFAAAFSPERDGRDCKCMHNNHKVLHFPISSASLCTSDAGAAKCWNDYKVLSTDSFATIKGKRLDGNKIESTHVEHHPDAHSERAFAYDDIECARDGCKEEEDCFESELPGQYGGRPDAEKKIIGDILQHLQNGDITEDEIGESERMIIDSLTDDERVEVLTFSDVIAKDPPGPEDNLYNAMATVAGGPVTVRMLKDHYEKRLHGTGLSVPNLLAVAGIAATHGKDLDQELTMEQFKTFLKPECR